MKWKTYAKFAVALAGFVLTTAVSLDWGYEFPAWVPALSALVTALGVYQVPNQPYQHLLADQDTSDPTPRGPDGTTPVV